MSRQQFFIIFPNFFQTFYSNFFLYPLHKKNCLYFVSLFKHFIHFEVNRQFFIPPILFTIFFFDLSCISNIYFTSHNFSLISSVIVYLVPEINISLYRERNLAKGWILKAVPSLWRAHAWLSTGNKERGTASARKIMNITQDRFTRDISHSACVNGKIFLVSTEKLYYGDIFCLHKLFNISAHVSCIWTIIFPYCSREFSTKIPWKIWLNVHRILLYSLVANFVQF